MKSILLLMATLVCFICLYFGVCRIATYIKKVFHYDQSNNDTDEVVVQISSSYYEDKTGQIDGLNCANDLTCGTMDKDKGDNQIE